MFDANFERFVGNYKIRRAKQKKKSRTKMAGDADGLHFYVDGWLNGLIEYVNVEVR